MQHRCYHHRHRRNNNNKNTFNRGRYYQESTSKRAAKVPAKLDAVSPSPFTSVADEEEDKEEEERKDRFTTRDDDENFDDKTKTKKKRRRLDEESEGEKREKEEEAKEEADAVTSSDPISTKKESKILITFPWMCDVCFEGEGRKVVAQSEHQRNDHLNSKKHKKNCEKRRGRELLRTMFFAEKKETTLGT